MEDGRYNTGVPEWWFNQTYALSEILYHVVPLEDSESHAVGMAGSAPLMLLQEKHRIVPVWRGEVNVDSSEKDHLRSKENLFPGDYDVFVCGPNGRTEDAFREYVRKLCVKLEEIGWPVYDKRLYRHTYGKDDRPIMIFDLEVKHINCKLSLIQCPSCDKIQEVVEGFDIDVCRVIYHPHDGSIECRDAVIEQISNCTASADGCRFGESGPTVPECRRIFRTMMRVMKYMDRGFRFPNVNGVRFDVESNVVVWKNMNAADSAANVAVAEVGTVKVAKGM